MTRLLVMVSVAAGLLAVPVSAMTLKQALAATYAVNPRLNAEREALKSSDAGVAVARAGGRPQVVADVVIYREIQDKGSLSDSSAGPALEGEVGLSLPIFRGGQVRNEVKAAKARVLAGRATLRALEGDIMLEAVTAYMDLIRDRAIAGLHVSNVKVLEKDVEATRDRFSAGELTRTDIAQAEARLAQARADLAQAEGQLATASEKFRQVIGAAPGQLEPPPPLPMLPATPDEAVRIALVASADLAASQRQVEAAGFDVGAVRARRLPTLSAEATGDYVNTIAGPTDGQARTGSEVQVGLEGSIPFYQGGRVAAEIRQRQALEGQAEELLIGTERAVIAETRSAFAEYRAAAQAIVSSEASVKANELALEGARAENSVGTRTILDVLNAEQELLDSQVSLVTARRDSYVAGFRLLNAMGQAEADKLGLDGLSLYDPLVNYRQVAGDLNDWSSDRRHGPRSTRTSSTPDSGQ